MNYAIILSGGVGTRMRSDGFPKQYVEVAGKPILIYTLECFEKHAKIDRIVLVAAKEWQEEIRQWLKKYQISKVSAWALPGETRQGSIVNGLEACATEKIEEEDLVIIHDAVRPLVSEELITACLDNAAEAGGCMPVLPVKDTIYTSMDGSTISGLLDRNTLFGGQAPEAFLLGEYLKLNREASKEEIDSYKGTSEIAFRRGMTVRMIPGDERNFKLTTPVDLEKFQMIVKEEQQ